MTSTIVPPVDLAPGMPSRVVTISATDVTEGGKSLEGQMVRFALSDTLDVTSGGDVIAKTQAEVVLDADGSGSIRLPVYDENVKTWCGQDWAILVTATWGSQKAIRVPAGTGSVALSALSPVRPLRGREKQWAITGASVTVTEGGSWDASLDFSGGILNLGLTVPPGGVAWYKGTLADGSDLDALDMSDESGVYYLSPNNTYLNGPWNLAGNRATLKVEATGFSGTQTISIYQSSTVWRRDMNNSNTRPRGWTDWKRVDVTVDQLAALEDSLAGVMNWNGTIPEGTNFNDLRWQSTNGIHQIHGAYAYTNEPPGRTGPGMLVSFSTSNGETWQRAIWRGGGVTERYQLTSDGQFSEWTEPGSGGGGSGGEVGNEAEALAYMQPLTTAFEVTQRFTPYEAIDGFVGLLGKRYPNRLEVMDVGTGFSGRRIRTIRLGDPTKPTLHLMAAQHGNEPMGKEATLALARRLAEDTTLEAFLTEACILITPVVNVDRINEERQNGSGTNLNRNWQTKTTREVQAMAALMDSHDVVLAVDLHEGGSTGVTMTDPPSHADVAPSLVSQSEALISELATVLADTEYPQADWPSSGNPETFVNGAALEWQCSTILIEGRSNLGAGNIYWPPVDGRFTVYNLIVDTIVAHFRDHLQDYVAAKAAAQA